MHTITSSVPGRRRSKASTLSAASSTASQAKPAGSPSDSNRAGWWTWMALRSPTRRCTPAWRGSRRRLQSRPRSWDHSLGSASSPPMKSSCLPGWAHIHAYSERRLANRAASSAPGILPRSGFLRCTTSSWLSGQHEVLRPRVGQPEGEPVVALVAVQRVGRPVVERVVHPPHVPLVGEAEAPGVDGTADPGPGGGLLGDREHTRVLRVHHRVQLLEEGDRLEVLVARRARSGIQSPGPRE